MDGYGARPLRWLSVLVYFKLFHWQVKKERKNLGEHLPVISTANNNLVRFIDYKRKIISDGRSWSFVDKTKPSERKMETVFGMEVGFSWGFFFNTSDMSVLWSSKILDCWKFSVGAKNDKEFNRDTIWQKQCFHVVQNNSLFLHLRWFEETNSAEVVNNKRSTCQCDSYSDWCKNFVNCIRDDECWRSGDRLGFQDLLSDSHLLQQLDHVNSTAMMRSQWQTCSSCIAFDIVPHALHRFLNATIWQMRLRLVTKSNEENFQLSNSCKGIEYIHT